MKPTLARELVLDAILMVAKLLADHGSTGIGCVDVMPQATTGGDLSQTPYWVDGSRARGTDRRAEECRSEAGGDVGGDRRLQGGRVHGECIIYVD